MKERDYIVATELARLRAAVGVLRTVVPGNVAEVVGISDEQAEAEFTQIMRRLDVWVARLERKVSPRAPDKEPQRREWPK